MFYDYTVDKTIPAFSENVLVYNDTKGPLPWFCKKCTYILMSMFCLSWY